jgi:hypothetical protein
MDGAFRRTMQQGVAFAALGVAAMTGAHGQSLTPAQALLSDPFVFSAGVFIVGTDISAGLNGQSSRNPSVDFDQTLGRASDASRGRIDALWRINPRHHIRLAYFNYDTTRNRVLDRDVAWGDNTYRAGANLTSNTKFSNYEVDYEYAFMRSLNYEVAGTLGIHYTDFSLNLTGIATVNGPAGGTTTTGLVSRTGKVPAPLPVLGIRGGWAVSPNIVLDARLQFLGLDVNGDKGNWSDAHVGATWMFSRHFGVGLGYDRFNTRLDVTRSDFNGQLKLGYSGVQAYLTGTF